MKRRGSKRGGFEPERLVKAAVEAYLYGQPGGRRHPEEKHARRRVGGRALALGVAIGIGAHAVYRRVRDFDLERAARAAERRMVN